MKNQLRNESMTDNDSMKIVADITSVVISICNDNILYCLMWNGSNESEGINA